MLIGFNIVKIIDSKLTNVQVTIPNITLPKPEITINIDGKRLDSFEYKYHENK